MAGGETKEPFVIDPGVAERWRLARRDDLYNAFGIMLSIPIHGQDEEGRWKYGLGAQSGIANADLVSQFEQEMRSLIVDRASALSAQGVIPAEQVELIESHPYSVGPAAQEWPKVFFELYRDARPIMNDGASLLAWGYMFIDVARQLWSWASTKQREQSEYPEDANITYTGHGAVPGFVLTRPGIVAVCYTEMVNSHGVTGDVILETFPRSKFPGIADANHPAGQESYLVRARVGRRSYFYQVLGTGEFIEHYSMENSVLTLHVLPPPIGQEPLGEDVGYQRSQIGQPQRLTIKGR